jgi:hypothetical protein
VVDLVVVGGPEAVHVDRRLAVLRKMFRKFFFIGLTKIWSSFCFLTIRQA